MKIVVKRDSFLSAIHIAASVVPSRTPKPILLGLKIESVKGGIVVSATDLEVGVTVRCDDADVIAPGAVVVNAARLLAITQSSSDETVSIEETDTGVAIKDENGKFRLTTEDAKNFPDVPGFDSKSYRSVAFQEFVEAINRTIFVVDSKSTRYALGGALIRPKNIISTDGRRASWANIVTSDVGSPNGAEAVVPTKALTILSRAKLGDSLDLYVSEKNAAFRSGGFVLSSRVLEGRFPRVEDVFPARSGTTVHIPVGALLAAIQRVAITLNEVSRGADLVFANGNIELRSSAAECGDSVVSFPASINGPDVTVCIGAAYLIDMLRTLPAESELEINIVDHNTPVVFKLAPNYRYLVMPLTSD